MRMCETIPVNLRRGERYDIGIGRGFKCGHHNLLANPYQIGPDGDRSEVLRKYAYDFRLRWRTEMEFRKAILSCKGKRLGCFCKPEPCHGDVIDAFVSIYGKEGDNGGFAAINRLVNSW